MHEAVVRSLSAVVLIHAKEYVDQHKDEQGDAPTQDKMGFTAMIRGA